MVKSFYHIEVVNQDTDERLFSAYRHDLKVAREVAKKIREELESDGFEYFAHDSHTYLVEWSEYWLFEKDCECVEVSIRLDDCAMQDRDGKVIYFADCETKTFEDESEALCWMLEEEQKSSLKLN